jgi:threonine dehydrogenase-like Zn-dependent dehydrogenase
VSVDTVDDPRIEKPTDVIQRVTSTAICGSDLHIYNGYSPQPKPMVLGHEFMGVVEEAGAEVKKLRKGDRVVVPFPGVRLVMGQATVHRYIDDLMELVSSGKVRLDDVLSHQLPLADAAKAYEIFNARWLGPQWRRQGRQWQAVPGRWQ